MSRLKRPEIPTEIIQINKKMQVLIDQHRKPNKIQLAPIQQPLRKPDSLL